MARRRRSTCRPAGRSSISGSSSIRAGPRTSGSRPWSAARQSGRRAPHHRVPGAARRHADGPGRPLAERTGWAPSRRACGRRCLPDGMARYVQKGSKLLFEMHYTANGTPQQDRSYVGFMFADPQDGEEGSGRAERGQLHVQDSAAAIRITRSSRNFVFRQNALLLVGLAAHARPRQGLSLRPDLSGRQDGDHAVGSAVRLRLADDLRVGRAEARAARHEACTASAHFDNSADNLANPDPVGRSRLGASRPGKR